MSLIFDALTSSLEEHSLIGIHSNLGDLSKFSLGWVAGLSDHGYSLETVDEFGGPDCVQVGKVSDIIKISRRGTYFDHIESIMSRNPAFSQVSRKFEVADIVAAIETAVRESLVISVIFEDRSESTGPILRHDGHELEIGVYDQVGQYEGDEILRIEDIFRLELFGRKQNLLEALISQGELRAHIDRRLQ